MAQERILVADDEPGVREMCMRALRMAGYDVTGVADAERAVQRAQEEVFDALVTDLKMPRMSGLDACRILHKVRPDMAMIVMTGYGTMESAIEALTLGVSEFILKPFRPDELNRTVARALERQHLEKENARLNALLPLLDLSRVFMSSVQLDTILHHVARITMAEMSADRTALRLSDILGQAQASSGEIADDDRRARCKEAERILIDQLAEKLQPIVLSQGQRFALEMGVDLASLEFAHVVVIPLIHQEQLLGGLVVWRSQDDEFTAADTEFLSVLTGQASAAIDNARLFREIQDAYRRLAELDHLKSEFINIASHELRTPLATLLAYTTILDLEVEGESREYIAQVLDSAMQLKSIIDEMVSLQRIDTGQALVQHTEFDMMAIVESLVKEIEPLVTSKRLDLSVEQASEPLCLQSDAQVVRLVLGSLLSNAIKFTPEGGAIRIGCKLEGGRLVTSVQDTGVGIPESELDRIFDRFYQVEHSMTRVHGGIGLGLAIAREMVDLIDGQITVSSQVNEGSVFSLWLPWATSAD